MYEDIGEKGMLLVVGIECYFNHENHILTGINELLRSLDRLQLVPFNVELNDHQCIGKVSMAQQLVDRLQLNYFPAQPAVCIELIIGSSMPFSPISSYT